MWPWFSWDRRSGAVCLTRPGPKPVGGVVVARYGSNPMQVIENLKAKIDENRPGAAGQKPWPDGTESRVTIVPF